MAADWLDVSRETRGRLETLVEMLGQWNRRINLVAPATIKDAWTRHVLDSAQFWTLSGLDGSSGKVIWADLGSGAGFPGLVVATIAAERMPGCEVMLVEADARKAAFMTAYLGRSGVTADVHIARIESLSPIGADIVSARALASLPKLLPLAVRHLADGGRMLFAKGREYRSELTEAERDWHMEVAAHQSRTSGDSAILEITGARRRA